MARHSAPHAALAHTHLPAISSPYSRRSQLRIFFPDVYIAKPSSSRTSSVEAFVVARGFELPEGFERGRLHRITTDNYSSAATSTCGGGGGGGASGASAELCQILPFVACGDLSGYDADITCMLSGYDPDITCMLEAAGEPPYRTYLEAQRQRATTASATTDACASGYEELRTTLD